MNQMNKYFWFCF